MGYTGYQLLYKGNTMPKEQNWVYQFAGACFATISGILFTLNNAIIKYRHIYYEDVLLVIGVVAIMICFILIKIKGHHVWYLDQIDSNEKGVVQVIKVRCLLVLQGLCNGVSTMGFYIAISNMPLGDAMSIIFSTPLPTMIFARLFFGQRLRLYKITCAVLLILGIGLIVQTPFGFGTQSNLSENNTFNEINEVKAHPMVNQQHANGHEHRLGLNDTKKRSK